MSFDISVFLLRWDKKRLGAGRLFDKKPRGARHAHRGVGGEGETRTPAPVTRPTPLAGAPRHQLEYFSMVTSKKDEIVYIKRERLRITFWRREWDSNPRMLSHRRFSRPVLSTTQPSLRAQKRLSCQTRVLYYHAPTPLSTKSLGRNLKKIQNRTCKPPKTVVF